MKSKILITGGAGYIGSHLSHKLSKSFEVLVVDNLKTGSVNNIKNLRNIKFFKVDILNKKKLDLIFEKNKIDIVIHLAALIKLDESISKPQMYWKNNLIGTKNILNCMIEYNVKKIIFSSTAAVYKWSKKKINENNKIELTNPYAETKFFSEQLIDIYSKLFNLKSIIFRFFNVAGANYKIKVGDRIKPPTHFITILLHNILRNKYTTIFRGLNTPDKSGIRDYIHIEDVCKAFEKAIYKYLSKKKDKKTILQIFNLGTAKGNSTQETVFEAKKIIKNKVFKIYDGKKRSGDQSIVVCDYKKAKKHLNWSPKNSNLKKIISSSYEWEKFLKNEK